MYQHAIKGIKLLDDKLCLTAYKARSYMSQDYVRLFKIYFAWLRITDEVSVSEMRILSILLIKSDIKWLIHISRSIDLYFELPHTHNTLHPVSSYLNPKFEKSIFRQLTSMSTKDHIRCISVYEGYAKKMHKTYLIAVENSLNFVYIIKEICCIKCNTSYEDWYDIVALIAKGHVQIRVSYKTTGNIVWFWQSMKQCIDGSQFSYEAN